MVAMAAGAIIAVAFYNGGSSAEREAGQARETPRPRREPGVLLPTATLFVPSTALPPGVDGFSLPVEGACLTENEDLLPGARRSYRLGVHEGVDFYDADNCVPIGINTDVLAAKAGTVVRADLNYRSLTEEDLAELEERVEAENGSDPAAEDAYRGRQVWIDHGNGIVTRYAHLNAIAEGVEAGAEVEAGQVIGYVGESGSPESVTDPGIEVHLHFEIRVGDMYLGQGLPPLTARELYRQAFSE